MADISDLLLENKTVSKIWLILEDCFQYILSMNISIVFLDGCMRKSMEFENIINYTSSYQAIYNNMTSLFKLGSRIQMETIEFFL